MKKYDFDVFNKKGDFAYDIHGAFMSDIDVIRSYQMVMIRINVVITIIKIIKLMMVQSLTLRVD